MEKMSNLRGPCEVKRKLYAGVVHSISLYGAPVWSEKLMQVKSNRREILQIQRRMALRVICGYRTVSYEAAMILARIPPIQLVAKRLRRIYLGIRDHRARGTLQDDTYDELWRANTILMRRQWKDAFSEKSLPGRRVREAILPIFEEWLDRGYGDMGYYLTQMMTGHGAFAEYTYRIRKTGDERCQMCGAETDSVEHTVAECPRWEIWREELVRNISGYVSGGSMDEMDMTIGRLVPMMVRERAVWRAVVTFTVSVDGEGSDGERKRVGDEHHSRCGASGGGNLGGERGGRE